MLGQDLRFALRTLARQPGFCAVAVLTLALAIGANTAIFSVVKSVLIEPLAYRDPGSLVAVRTWWQKTARAGSVSGGDYPDLIAGDTPFAAASRYAGGELAVRTPGKAEFAYSFGVDGSFFDVFAERPIAGRLPSRDEFRAKAELAVVGEAFANRHFGSPAAALGKVVRLDGHALAVVGVLPASFQFPLQAEIWMPLFYENPNRTAHNYRVVARLKPGFTPEQANAHAAAVGARLQQAFPGSHQDKSFRVTPLRDMFTERSRFTLLLLMGAVGLVLLVACANVANLLLARATARAREMALRAALGAGRLRLVKQLLVESAVLGVAGGLLGLALAAAGLAALTRLAPANLPRIDQVRVDPSVLLFTFAVALGSAVLFGLAPALRTARVDLQDALKQGGLRGVLGARGGHSLRGALVASEIALALMLTLGAGLLFRSFLAVNAVDLGYHTDGRLVATVTVPAGTEAQYLQAGATFERIFSSLREIPGVTQAAGVMGLPGGPYGSNGLYGVEGLHSFQQLDKLPQAGFRLTSPGYFEAMGVPVLAGRDFNERDLFDAEPVALVSATLARQVFPGADPIGRRIKCGLDRDVWMRVVGVVGDMRNDNPATPPGPELYMPYRQHPYHANELHVVVRTAGDPGAFAPAVRRAIAAIDPEIPLKLAPLEHFRAESVALPRFRTTLFLVFAGLAALLALAGVYGVMSYLAAQRRQEMGLRLALGARAGDVLRLMVGSGARLAAIGLAAGLAGAAVLERLIRSFLFGVQSYDAPTIAAAVAALGAGALLAALLPALRSSRVDPALTLRQE